jgi:hypothetical protein
MYQYLVVDAALNGTGVRTDFTSSDVKLDELNISESLKTRIVRWLDRYQEQQFQGFEDAAVSESLDAEGLP